MGDRVWLAALFLTIMKVCVRTSQATGFSALPKYCLVHWQIQGYEAIRERISHSPACLYSRKRGYSLAHDLVTNLIGSCFLKHPMGYTVLKPRVRAGHWYGARIWNMNQRVGKAHGEMVQPQLLRFNCIWRGTTRFLDNMAIIMIPEVDQNQ